MLKLDIPGNHFTRRNLIWWFSAVLWFAAWHLFITWCAWGDPLARVPGPVGDNTMMTWNLGWVKYAIEHGSPGFWSSVGYYPHGHLFIYGSHTWLDGFLYWVMSPMLPSGYEGAVLWANITMLLATVATGVLIISGLRAWGVSHWPVLFLVATGVTFSWFRMYALTGHYNFLGTQWMLLALCLLSWAWEAFGRGDGRQGKRLCAFAGLALGVSSLNDQTMAIFAGIMGGLILVSLPASSFKLRSRLVVAAGARYYAFALVVASVHLIPIIITTAQGRLHYHVDKSLPRLVDATSFFLPNDYHFLGPWLQGFRQRTGFSWSEGTYLGIVPILLLLLSSAAAIVYAVRKSPDGKVCAYATLAAWGFIIIALGDRLMIGREQLFLLPERLLKEIPLLNNMRVPQRWVWPAHLCIALAGGSLLAKWAEQVRRRWLAWALLPALAVIPPLEGRSYPVPAPVNFRDETFMRPPGLIKAVMERYRGGGVLTMPIEATHAHANILQFLWGYDIPMTVVYTARMPLTQDDLPWSGSAWTAETGNWLRDRQVSIIVFPYHGGGLEEFQGWISEAKMAVPGLLVLDKNGEER